MIKKIVVDGNDGAGKTYTIDKMKELFPGIEFEDRGIFSEDTLNEKIFEEWKARLTDGIKDMGEERYHALYDFLHEVEKNKDTLYVICLADPKECQKRIVERGDSIEEEYHTMEDLVKYDKRFRILCDITAHLSNVMLVDTTNRKIS